MLFSCSNNLSRGKAKELIIQKMHLPQIETTKMLKRYLDHSWGDMGFFSMPKVCYVVGDQYSDVKGRLDDLQAKGVINITQSEEYNDGCHFVWKNVNLTDEGKKYLVADANGEYELRTSELAFGQVTGIQVNEQFKVAEANFTIRRVNATPFADNDVSRITDIDNAVNFSLYDDGWRINN